MEKEIKVVAKNGNLKLDWEAKNLLTKKQGAVFFCAAQGYETDFGDVNVIFMVDGWYIITDEDGNSIPIEEFIEAIREGIKNANGDEITNPYDLDLGEYDSICEGVDIEEGNFGLTGEDLDMIRKRNSDIDVYRAVEEYDQNGNLLEEEVVEWEE